MDGRKQPDAVDQELILVWRGAAGGPGTTLVCFASPVTARTGMDAMALAPCLSPSSLPSSLSLPSSTTCFSLLEICNNECYTLSLLLTYNVCVFLVKGVYADGSLLEFALYTVTLVKIQ